MAVPTLYLWTAAIAVGLVMAAACALLYLIVRQRFLRRQSYREFCTRQGLPWPPRARPSSTQRASYEQLRSIAGRWATARVVDEVDPAIGWLMVATAVLVVGVLITYGRLGDAWLAEHTAWLFPLLTVAWLLIVGRNAYRNPSLLRVIGVLWDLGAFWPRVVHPLAPPCYNERVMPDLLERIARLAPGHDDTVVISAEGRSTMIAVALVLQLDPKSRRHVRLVSYVDPLQRLYLRWFPGYFGPTALRRVGDVLLGRQVVVE